MNIEGKQGLYFVHRWGQFYVWLLENIYNFIVKWNKKNIFLLKIKLCFGQIELETLRDIIYLLCYETFHYILHDI